MAIFENTTESETTGAKKSGIAMPQALQSILIKPRISEKAAKANEAGKYIFEVARKANKISIKKAVEKTFNVTVVQVNIINTEGKKRTYGKTSGTMSDFKKAIITLKKGQTIDTPQAKI